MTVKLIGAYSIGLVGLVAGGGIGLVVGALRSRVVGTLDARLTLPLLLAAAGAHLALISVVEPQRQVLFGLYGLALIGVVVFASTGLRIWRLGGALFPAGSIAAYFYFAIPEHQADFIGLGVKVVELAAIVAVIAPVFRPKSTTSRAEAA